MPLLIETFLTAYQEGNPDLRFSLEKMIVAAYDRALRNVITDVKLRYTDNNFKWEKSIELNLNRLKHVEWLTGLSKKPSINWNVILVVALAVAIFWILKSQKSHHAN